MKIDDFLDKTLVASTKLTRKPKATDKPKADASAIQGTDNPEKGVKANKTSKYVDTFESTEGQSMSKAQREPSADDSPPVRQDRVAYAKQMVAAGAYNNKDVIEKIIDRLLDTIREA